MSTGKELYEYKIQNPDKTWREIGERYGLTDNAARKRSAKYYNTNDLPPPTHVEISGSIEDAPQDDRESLWKQAMGYQERAEMTREHKESRRVFYREGPVVLVCMGDMHLGSPGVDYKAIDQDIRMIRQLSDSVQVGVVLGGDLIDNFIIGKLQNLRMNTSPFLAVEEWGLVDYALERLAPFIIGSVAGNHDNWTWAVAGVDILRQRHRELTPGIMYDAYELRFTLQVGESETIVAVRHNWKGHSKYNPTHGIEDHHWRRGREFDVAVGAHTHRGGLAREFDNGGEVGHALILGTYKKDDDLGKKLGLPPVLPTAAVALVVDDDGVQFATSNLFALPRLFE